jgi:hypothetical protein
VLKIYIAIEPVNLGSNGKHAKHYTIEATECIDLLMSLKKCWRIGTGGELL